MGNWNINIQGVGCHHNGKPEIDADLAAAAFVETLRKQGHTIEAATFTYGGKVDLLPKVVAVGGSITPYGTISVPEGKTLQILSGPSAALNWPSRDLAFNPFTT